MGFLYEGAGESYVSHVESYQVDQNSALGTYQDTKAHVWKNVLVLIY